MSDNAIKTVKGRGIPVRGNDIDTDRIIPARFLKCVTFEALGPESFRDDRFDQDGKSKNHSFDNPKYQGANILFVNKNFGCGSSREHAPQALQRWGIDAIVGESFAEIFFGNCVALGIPCMVATKDVIEKAMGLVESNAEVAIELNVDAQIVKVGGESLKVQMPDGPRGQLVNGSWDATFQLLENEGDVNEVAGQLPYVSGW